MRLPTEIEERWKAFKAEAEAHGANEPDDEEFQTYTSRDPISDTWQTKGKVIRLDDVILCMHLMAARHSFHGLSKVWQRSLIKIAEYVAGYIGSAVALRLAGRIIGRTVFGQLASTVTATIADTAVQRDIESSIRTSSFSARDDLFRNPLKANPRRARKTKLVFTRHPIPKQRKPNKSWRSPKR